MEWGTDVVSLGVLAILVLVGGFVLAVVVLRFSRRRDVERARTLVDALTRGNSPAALLPGGEREAEEIITLGDSSHQHRFTKAGWDTERLGPDVIDFSDSGYATFKYLFQCPCGAEKVASQRALY